jgi:hypothetical protein
MYLQYKTILPVTRETALKLLSALFGLEQSGRLDSSLLLRVQANNDRRH